MLQLVRFKTQPIQIEVEIQGSIWCYTIRMGVTVPQIDRISKALAWRIVQGLRLQKLIEGLDFRWWLWVANLATA